MIGGANYVAVKFSNAELDPMYGAFLRFAASGVLLFLITVIFRLEIPRGRAVIGAVTYGILGFGLAYGLLYFALVGLSAGTASVMTASVPLMTFVVAVVHRQETFSWRGVVGGIFAIAGIAILSAPSIGGEIRPIYYGASMLGVVAIAYSSVVIKAFPRAHPVVTNAIGMTTGGALLALASLLFGETWALPQTGQTWLVLVWLVVAGSIGLFALFLFLIARWTASASVYVLALMPVVAVTLGALIADEPVTVNLIAGGLLVLIAVYVGAISGRHPTLEAEHALVTASNAERGTGSG